MTHSPDQIHVARNGARNRGGTDRPLDDDLVAAVVAEVRDYGVRRATASSIATRAGVSRVTLYRRGGSVRSLVLDALSAEFARVLGEAAATTSGVTARERLVDLCLRAVDVLAHDPLVEALLRHDPELLLPYLVDRPGQSQLNAARLIEAGLAAGHADASIRELDGHVAATTILHALTPFVVSARLVESQADVTAVHTELATMLDGYLRPTGAPAPPGTPRAHATARPARGTR